MSGPRRDETERPVEHPLALLLIRRDQLHPKAWSGRDDSDLDVLDGWLTARRVFSRKCGLHLAGEPLLGQAFARRDEHLCALELGVVAVPKFSSPLNGATAPASYLENTQACFD